MIKHASAPHGPGFPLHDPSVKTTPVSDSASVTIPSMTKKIIPDLCFDVVWVASVRHDWQAARSTERPLSGQISIL